MASGTIIFATDFEPFSGATAYIRLEEVTRTDAPAHIAAETILRNVRIDRGDAKELRFAIKTPALESNARYVIRIHVDLDGDGRVGIGDYVSTASHPVSPVDEGAPLVIAVKRVV